MASAVPNKEEAAPSSPEVEEEQEVVDLEIVIAASKYAAKGLDKLGEKLPLLPKPVQEIRSDTKELLSSRVAEVKEAVSSRALEVLDVTGEMLQGCEGAATPAVTSAAWLGPAVGQMGACGAEAVLGTAEGDSLSVGNEELGDGESDAADGPQAGPAAPADLLGGAGCPADPSLQPAGQAQQALRATEELHAAFSGADSFQDLSSCVLTRSQREVAVIQEGMEELLDYLKNNTPLSWLVGSSFPREEEEDQSRAAGAEHLETSSTPM
ncbi:Perilipin-3 [Lonchura striata]|uniref:Perilipin-3 n=1 Tax=Lonchura striata TaxID=40157 RepID=A0A218UFT9_9PASE|nr:Perilipin-3 [Lonchura striata domestica]